MTNETFLMQVPPNFYQRNILGFALTLIICSDVDKQITQRFAKMHFSKVATKVKAASESRKSVSGKRLTVVQSIDLAWQSRDRSL